MNKLIIPLLVLFTSGFAVAGEINVNNSKSVTYTKQHTEHWDKKPWARSVSDNSYRKFQTEAMKARYEGYLSKQTVNATIEASVSRKTVLNGSFALVKQGAKFLASRANVYVGGALLAYEAYQAVKGDIESQGYKWNEASEEFLKEWPARNCLVNRDNEGRLIKVACYGVDSSVLSAYRKGGKSRSEAEQLMKGQMENLAGSFWDKHKMELDTYSGSKFWEYFTLDECRFNLNGGDCLVKSGSDYRSPISFALYMRDTEVLDQKTFLQIATQSIDGNPKPFVEGTGRPDYKENIKVPAGTVVTIGPVETPEGKKTYTVTFTNPTNGGSSEASVQTNNSPAPTGGSPDGSPDGKPDGKPDGNPDRKPDDKSDDKPDHRPDEKPDDKPDGKDGKDGKDAQDLCEKHPEASACKDLGDTNYKDLEIPVKAINLELKPLDIFSTNGTCPANPTFSLGVLGTFEIPYDYFCNIARLLRPILILGTIIMCGFFAFNAVKEL